MHTSRHKDMAAFMALMGGFVGGQFFYLGQVWRGIFSLLLFWTFVPFFIGLYQGIYWTLESYEDFHERYGSGPLVQASPSKDFAVLYTFFWGTFGLQFFYMGRFTLGYISVLLSWTLLPFFFSCFQTLWLLWTPYERFQEKYPSTGGVSQLRLQSFFIFVLTAVFLCFLIALFLGASIASERYG